MGRRGPPLKRKGKGGLCSERERKAPECAPEGTCDVVDVAVKKKNNEGEERPDTSLTGKSSMDDLEQKSHARLVATGRESFRRMEGSGSSMKSEVKTYDLRGGAGCRCLCKPGYLREHAREG